MIFDKSIGLKECKQLSDFLAMVQSISPKFFFLVEQNNFLSDNFFLSQQTLDELPLEAETVEKGYSLGLDPTGLLKIYGLPSSSMYYSSSSSSDYSASPNNPRSHKSSHSGELQSHFYSNADSNGGSRPYMPRLYRSIDV